MLGWSRLPRKSLDELRIFDPLDGLLLGHRRRAHRVPQREEYAELLP